VSIGRAVRTRLGRFEAPVSDFYRGRFVDLDACARILGSTVQPHSILEIGCGDGQMANQLVERFPAATYQGIDVAPEVGRLFEGASDRANFLTIDTRSFRQGTDARYQLVVVVDVLHHVPKQERADLLDDVRELTAAGGHYAIKDWVRSRSLAHLAAWASDRIVTGDRVAYFDPGELPQLVSTRFPDDRPVLTTFVPPRRNNVMVVSRRHE
jgi:2-polyprenyl-3-methyl-5-hydroxy-6-metoxy-1,4-benzoquinol methylase